MKISDLQPNPRNPRKITDERADLLRQALEHFGDLSGIVLNRRTGRLVGGHQRVKQLAEGEVVRDRTFDTPTRAGTVAEGYALVDGERFAFREVDWDEDTEKAANIAANKHGGEFDLPLLNDFLLELDAANFDLGLTGFTPEDLEDLLAPIERVDPQEDEDTHYEPPKDPIVKPGDFFELGNHRLLCGDSINIQHVERLLAGERAAMVVTDPPYNVNYGAANGSHPHWGKGQSRTIMNDKMSAEDFREFCRGFVSSIVASTAGCVYVFGPPGPDGRIMFSECDAAMHCSTTIIWNKDRFVLGRGKYHTKYEPCWFGWVTDGSRFTKDRTLTNVWDCKRPGVSELHPTMKPVELIETAILHASQERDVVLDLFGGSGTTMIACEKTARAARLMELDPKYAQVIVNRWCGFTGKEAYLVSPDGTRTPWSALLAGAQPQEGTQDADETIGV